MGDKVIARRGCSPRSPQARRGSCKSLQHTAVLAGEGWRDEAFPGRSSGHRPLVLVYSGGSSHQGEERAA